MKLNVLIRVENTGGESWDKKFEDWTHALPSRGDKIWWREGEQPAIVEHLHWEFLEEYNHVIITCYQL